MHNQHLLAINISVIDNHGLLTMDDSAFNAVWGSISSAITLCDYAPTSDPNDFSRMIVKFRCGWKMSTTRWHLDISDELSSLSCSIVYFDGGSDFVFPAQNHHFEDKSQKFVQFNIYEAILRYLFLNRSLTFKSNLRLARFYEPSLQQKFHI